MREKLVELAKEVWEDETLTLSIPAGDLQIEAEAGSSVQGVFHIQNAEGRMMRGRVYLHGNTRLRLTKAEFSGTEGIVSYEFCAEGLLCGEAQKCTVEVYANGAFLQAECKVQVILPYIDSSIGRLDHLMHFTELCKKDWKEARQIFCSADFERVFLQDDERTKKIYEGLLRGEGTSNAMEEFLIAERRKRPVQLSAQKNNLSFSGVKNAREEIVVLKRSSWGYGKYTVSSNCAFLKPDRNLLWTDSFVNDEYSLGVVLLPQNCHKGRNIGVITLKSVTDCLDITIEIVEELSEEEILERRQRRHLKEAKLQLFKGFRGYAVGWLKGKAYANRQREILKKSFHGISSDWKELCRVHFACAEGEMETAAELLRKLTLSGEPAMIFGEHCRQDMEKNVPVSKERLSVYGIYLYLSVLLQNEKDGDEREILLRYLESLRKYAPEQEILLWLSIAACMTVLEKADGQKEKASEKLAEYLLLLRGSSEKNGAFCDSSFLYILACRIWNLRPDMLTRLDRFSVPALNFGIRHKMITKTLRSQFVYLAGSANRYHPLVFSCLCFLYKENPSNEILSALLRHLIRGQQAGKRYLPYFRLGIEKRLRITQLYEYFMDSMSEDDMGQLPPQVLTYFQFACNLPDRKKAALYANIVTNKTADPQSYLNYQGQMEKFALEQVLAHKISRNLSVLYADLLNSTNMDSLAEGHLAEIMFRQEIHCNHPQIKGVYILYEETNQEEYVPLVNGKALANLVTDRAVLLFEDRNGGRHYSTDYTVDRLFRLDELCEKCLEANPGNELLILSLLKKAEKKKTFGSAELFAMEKALFMEELTDVCREKVWFLLADYYYENFNEEMLKHLMELSVPMGFSGQKRMFEIYLSANRMEKAYEMLKKYYYHGILQQISAEKLSDFVHWQLEHVPEEEQEKKLLSKECYSLFCNGIADQEQITFLLQTMEGTVSELFSVWKHPQVKGEELQKDRCLLAENLLIHVLFSGLPLEKYHPVMIEYYKNRNVFKYTEHYHLTDLLIRAYLFVYASRYLHEQENEETVIFEIMLYELRHIRMQACKYALLKYYSGKESYQEEELSWIEANAKECMEEGMIFPFFRDFGEEVRLPSGVRNACYVSYTAPKSSVVTIHYCYQNATGQGDYESQVMKSRFQGIYVRSFLLFYDEKLTYYITEDQNGREIARTPEQTISDEKEPGGKENSFAQINLILAAKDMKDDVTMRQEMKHYIETAYAQKQLFKPFLHYGGEVWRKDC